MKRTAILLLAVLAAGTARAETKLSVGTVPTIGDGSLICADERGWFRDAGIALEVQSFRTAIDMVPLLVRGDLPIIAGGISVSYFNAVARGLPIRYFANRAGHPAYHMFVVRKELAGAIKQPADLKGRAIGITGKGGELEYETGKVLAAAGLSLDAIERKDLGMPEMPPALKNGAVDAAILVPPFDAAAEALGAVAWMDPDRLIRPPVEVSGFFLNTDWAAKNRGLVDRFMVAYLKGARCFLEGSRHGATRAAIIDMLVRRTPIKDKAVYEKMKWAELDPDGKIRKDSVLDQQEFFIARGYLTKRLPIDELVDDSYARRALKLVGPYQPPPSSAR